MAHPAQERARHDLAVSFEVAGAVIAFGFSSAIIIED